jgi:hypothetical protein
MFQGHPNPALSNKTFCDEVKKKVATGHLWLLNTLYVVDMTEELHCFILYFN